MTRDWKKVAFGGMVAIALHVMTPRRSRAESFTDLKFMFYQEDGDRIQVIAPSILVERDLSSTLTIRIDGIYNAISGATPTGAPPLPGQKTVTYTVSTPSVSEPSFDDDEGEGEDEEDEEDEEDHRARRSRRAFRPKAGASPSSSSSSGSSSGGGGGSSRTVTETVDDPSTYTIPYASFDDERYGFNIELSARLKRNTPSVQLSHSSETDYRSMGAAVRNRMEFNRRNTALTAGVGLMHDVITPVTLSATETKDTVDLMVGLAQVLDANTLLALNVTLSRVDGYLSDPYKVVEINGALAPERRPDTKDKQIAYVSLSRYLATLHGSIEGSYRYYSDSFGIDAHTASLAWYQRFGEHLILRPMVRFYDQTEADFYAVRFSGSQDYYSSDYRVSALSSLGYGLKVIVFPSSRVSLDVLYERYEQQGNDGETMKELYPKSNIIMGGIRVWF